MSANASPASTDREALSGVVERVTFHNPDNGFCVLRVTIRGQRDLVTLVGHSATITAGEFIQAAGTWINDRTHGLQFRATFLRVAAPTTAEGIEKYLASGLIKGIGPVYARKLVQAFGAEVFEVIEQQPVRLQEVAGIGPHRAQSIVRSWAEQRVIREIMLFLHSHGVGTARAVRIFKTYGAEAVQVISENPYRLAREIRGIGFVTADALAGKLGIAKDSMLRARAGISYALTTALDEGHCGLPQEELLALAERLLGLPRPLIAEALRLEAQAGEVVIDSLGGRPGVFLAGLYRAERSLAERLLALASGRVPWPAINADKAIAWVETKVGLALAVSQREALRLALGSKVLVITGGPGVGKTTLVNSLLEILAIKGVAIALAAPTGRAAKRLSDSTGREAKTIHRLLETDPATGGFRRGPAHPLSCDLLVIDETSMVDVPLMHALLKAVPERAALVLVGDVDQLPSVGPGQVLADLIASGAVPVVRLTEVFRQAAASRIIVNAHRINQGLMPEGSKGDPAVDFHLVGCAGPADGVAKIVALVRDRLPQRLGLDAVREIQVLCPMNRGGLGARALNLELQKALNPPGETKVERFGWTFCPGDKVMQTANDYEKEVYNGDLGVITTIDAEAGEVTIRFDGRPVVYGVGELDQVVLAYAITIHKSQGSEYPAVVIPLVTQHYTMLQRNLLYTAVTRGKRVVVVVSQPKALALAVKRDQERRRWSKLRDWLGAPGQA